jgi:hypothetical protein
MLRRRSLLKRGREHPFEPDANTVGLFHFDGSLMDECGILSTDKNRYSATVSYENSLCSDKKRALRVSSGTVLVPSFLLNSNFTVEFWMKTLNTSGNWKFQLRGATSADTYISTGNRRDIIMACQSGSKLYFTYPDGSNFTTTYDSTSVHHIAFVRNGTTLKIFVDGAKFKEVTFQSSCSYWLIWMGGGQPTVFDELRISNVARYNDNFDVPTGGG